MDRITLSLEQHPIGKCYPALSDAEFVKLKESIAKLGVLHPAVRYDGKILDGWCRAQACKELGIDLPIIDPVISDPYEFAAALNDRRRNLTGKQRAIVVGKLAKLKRGGQPGNLNQSTNMARGHIRANHSSITTLAKQHGVDKRWAARGARIVKLGIPELAEAVMSDKIGLKAAEVIACLPKEEQAAELHGANGHKPQTPKVTEPDPKRLEQAAFEARQLAIINAPSIFPVDAELPTHPTQEIHTNYIREGIDELRKHEPDIAKMSRGEIFKKIHPCTQRILTYGRYGDSDRVTGPIDPRFLEWAGACVSKFRAREAILLHREKASEMAQRPSKQKPKKVMRACCVGDEFSRLLKPFSGSFKKLLKEFPSQYEEQLTAEIILLVTNTFAEKREAHAKRLSLHKQNGATAP